MKTGAAATPVGNALKCQRTVWSTFTLRWTALPRPPRHSCLPSEADMVTIHRDTELHPARKLSPESSDENHLYSSFCLWGNVQPRPQKRINNSVKTSELSPQRLPTVIQVFSPTQMWSLLPVQAAASNSNYDLNFDLLAFRQEMSELCLKERRVWL